MVDGFPAYAPDVAQEGEGFRSEFYTKLAAAEDGHFWFRARNRLITWALQKYCPDFRNFLEVGCGTAYVLAGVSKAFPKAKVSGSELFSAGLRFAAERLPQADFMQMDARRIPFENEYDVIGAFDVIEHIEQDEKVFGQLHKAIRPGGHLIITVPQHEWLWSQYDDFACHCRRYTRNSLHAKVEAAGFEIVRSTSFISVLLPAMLASRVMSKHVKPEDYDASNELAIPAPLNFAFEKLLAAEAAAIRMGVDLPIGGSRLLLARKP